MKKVKYIQYVFMLISIALFLYFVFTNSDTNTTGVGMMLTWTYILLGIAVLATLLFPLINLFSNPKGAVRSLIGLGAVVVVIGVCYLLSSAEPVVNSAGGYFDNPMVLRLSDTGLYGMYFAMGATVLIVVGSEIANAFKH